MDIIESTACPMLIVKHIGCNGLPFVILILCVADQHCGWILFEFIIAMIGEYFGNSSRSSSSSSSSSSDGQSWLLLLCKVFQTLNVCTPQILCFHSRYGLYCHTMLKKWSRLVMVVCIRPAWYINFNIMLNSNSWTLCFIK